MKTFAPEYNTNKQGWFIFPKDADYRKKMFPEKVNTHPAKANIYLVQAIIEYVSNEGDLLMDVMAGSGSIMVAALVGRDVICVEISEKFYQMQVDALKFLENIAPGVSEHISLVNMPCQNYLPIPNLANHIIFSPQYAGILKSKEKDQSNWTRETLVYDWDEYNKSPLNLGTMTEFLWQYEMETVYKKCYDTLTIPGSMTLIVKDHISKGERVQLVQKAIDASVRVGFSYNLEEHFKWAAPGMPYTANRRAKGIETVDDESIVVLRKT